MMLARRGFLGGLGALLAAPAIIRTPGLLMPVKPVLPLGLTLEQYANEILAPAIDAGVRYNGLLTIEMISRETLQLWASPGLLEMFQPA